MAPASRDSAAYEYEDTAGSRQDIRKAPRPPARRRKKRRHRRRTRAGLWLGASAIAAVYLLFCQMQLTQLTAQVSDQTTQLEELTAQSVALSSKKEYSMDTDELEEYAVDQLGMVKMDNSQIEYVELTKPDNVTVTEHSFSLRTLCKTIVSVVMAVVEYIR